NQLGSGTQYPSADSPPMASPPFGSNPYYTPLQAATPLMQSQPAQTIVAQNAVQRFLVRMFGQDLAMNAFLGVVLGSVFAAIVGLLAAALVLGIVHAIVPYSPGGSVSNFGNTGAEDSLDYYLGIIPLHNPFRDSLQLFLVMQGVGIHLDYGTSSNALFGPLHGLL